MNLIYLGEETANDFKNNEVRNSGCKTALFFEASKNDDMSSNMSPVCSRVAVFCKENVTI